MEEVEDGACLNFRVRDPGLARWLEGTYRFFLQLSQDLSKVLDEHPTESTRSDGADATYQPQLDELRSDGSDPMWRRNELHVASNHKGSLETRVATRCDAGREPMCSEPPRRAMTPGVMGPTIFIEPRG
ncbi:unnamed protein product [Lota lota]